MGLVILMPPDRDDAELGPAVAIEREPRTSPPTFSWRSTVTRSARTGATMAGYPEVIVPESFLIEEAEGEDRFLYLKVFQTGNRRVVSIAVSDLDHLPVDMGDPHFDYDRLPEGIAFALREFDASLRRRRVPPTAQIELIVSDMLRDLEDENSELRRALDESRIEAAFLRGQLHALREAAAMGRRPITSRVVATIATVLLTVAGGAAGGLAQEVTAAAIRPDEVSQPAPDLDGAAVEGYIARCEAIIEMLHD